jgi:agmatinase
MGDSKFVTDAFLEDESNVIVFGVETPQSLREESQMVEPFDIDQKRNMLQNARIFDAGDIGMADVEKKASSVLESGKFPLAIGTEHTLTLHAMKAMPAGTVLVVFDAHADLKDEYEGDRMSHACWLRRWCELAKENPGKVAIVGMRSCDEDEYEYVQKSGILFFTSEDLHLDMPEVVDKLNKLVRGQDLYVSLDMDAFDPSISPAVKYPEPDGLSYNEFLTVVGEICQSCGKVVGMDCVEIRPIAGNKVTEHLATKSVFKIIGAVGFV